MKERKQTQVAGELTLESWTKVNTLKETLNNFEN